jgi:hypothetical protein
MIDFQRVSFSTLSARFGPSLDTENPVNAGFLYFLDRLPESDIQRINAKVSVAAKPGMAK